MNKNKELSLRGAVGEVAISCDKALSSRGRAESSDVAISCDKVLSFLSRCCASANQGISAPASCREAHKRRFLFNSKIPGIFRLTAKNRDDSFFVASPRTRFSEIATSAFRLLAMTPSTLALAAVLSFCIISESWAEINCTWDGTKLKVSGNGTFSGCGDNWNKQVKSVTEVDFDSGITELSPSVFGGAKELIRASGSGIQTIGKSAFSRLPKLETVEMPNVKTIESHAFQYNTNLKNVDISAVETIANNVFVSTQNLDSIYLPNVKKLSSDAFRGSGLKSIELPKIQKIGAWAFDNAENLIYIAIPETYVDENGNTKKVDIYSSEKYPAFAGVPLMQDQEANCRKEANYKICGNCGYEYAKRNFGCVKNCGDGYLGKEGKCIDSILGCGENYKDMGGFCNRIRYTPAEAAEVLKDTDNEIIMTFKVNR